MLHSLLSALAKTDSLPEEVRQLAAQAKVNQAHQEGKTLHKIVAQRTDALQNLEQLEKQRTAYEASWTTYMNQLFEIVEKQLVERETTLSKMQKSRESWMEQLSESTRQLKCVPDTEISGALPDYDMKDLDDADSVADKDSELEAARRLREKEKHERLRTALAAAREATLSETGRERTPRRKREPIHVDLSPKGDQKSAEEADPWSDLAAQAASATAASGAASAAQRSALLPFGKANSSA